MHNKRDGLVLLIFSARYGFFSGILGFALMLTLYYAGHHPFLIPVFFDYRIVMLSIVIFFTLKEIRNHTQKETFYFWQGMAGSIVLMIFFSFTSSALLYGYTILYPEFVRSYIDLSLQQVRTFSDQEIERIGKEIYEESIRALHKADGYFLAKRFFIQSWVISFFVSLIISVILRRRSYN